MGSTIVTPSPVPNRAGSHRELSREQPSKQKAVIVDMDGTLADVSSIRHHVEGGNRDFTRFHEESVNVPPNPEVVQQVRDFHKSGHAIVIVTARRARFRPHTAYWLAHHGVPSDQMVMRGDKDDRPDNEVKRDILKQVRSRYNVVHAIDDNPSVVKVWKDEGLGVTVVPGFSDEKGPEQ